MTTTKKDLIEAMVTCGVSPLEAPKALESLLLSMTLALRKGDRIEIRGFGVFEPKTRKGGFSNLTGQAIADKKTIKFKPGKELAIAIA